MNRKTRLIFAAAAAAIALPLAACSGGDGGSGDGSGGDYCGAVQELKDSSSGVDMTEEEPTPEYLRSFATALQKVADAAPDDVAADWKKTADYMNAAVTVRENPEEEIDAQTQQLLADESIDDTQKGLEKHALDECDVDLSGE